MYEAIRKALKSMKYGAYFTTILLLVIIIALELNLDILRITKQFFLSFYYLKSPIKSSVKVTFNRLTIHTILSTKTLPIYS